VLRGVFAGEGGTRSPGGDAFRAAVELSAEVNIETVERPFDRCITYLDPVEYRSTWLGNKAIYRTRLAMATGGDAARRAEINIDRACDQRWKSVIAGRPSSELAPTNGVTCVPTGERSRTTV